MEAWLTAWHCFTLASRALMFISLQPAKISNMRPGSTAHAVNNTSASERRLGTWSSDQHFAELRHLALQAPQLC